MNSVYELENKFFIGMHGLGSYKSTLHSNSFEAFQKWYSKGIKIFEVDIAITSDKKYVALAHNFDKETLYRYEIDDIPNECSKEWFLNKKLFSNSTEGLTTISVENIVEYLIKYDDTVFMLDLYGFFEYCETYAFIEELKALISANDNLYDRLLIEAYNFDMVRAIKKASSKIPIQMCLYPLVEENGNSIDYVIDELKRYNIDIVSFPWRYAKKKIDELRKVQQNNFIIFSYSIIGLSYKKRSSLGINVNLADYIFNWWDYFFVGFYAIYLLCHKNILREIKRKLMNIILRYVRKGSAN